MSRTLRVIAEEIRSDWVPVHYTAKPWLVALEEIDTIKDMYGADSGKTCVAYFLSNAGSWRGPVARRIKKELNALIK